MSASSLSFRSAVALAILGMIMGLAMAISDDHSVMPAHAHLNLIGWVSLFLIGIFYKLHPAIDASRTAFVQVGIWVFGTVVMTTGVALIYLGYAAAEPLASGGSIIILADMLVFAYLVYRPVPDGGATARLSPAE